MIWSSFTKPAYCLCVLYFLIACSSNNIAAAYPSVKKIYETEKNYVFFDSDIKKKNVLTKNSNFVYFLLESSRDNEWAIIAESPRYVGPGRVEQINFLYFVPNAIKIPTNIIGDTPLGFEMSNETEHLLLHDNRMIDLEELKVKILKSINLERDVSK